MRTYSHVQSCRNQYTEAYILVAQEISTIFYSFYILDDRFVASAMRRLTRASQNASKLNGLNISVGFMESPATMEWVQNYPFLVQASSMWPSCMWTVSSEVYDPECFPSPHPLAIACTIWDTLSGVSNCFHNEMSSSYVELEKITLCDPIANLDHIFSAIVTAFSISFSCPRENKAALQWKISEMNRTDFVINRH